MKQATNYVTNKGKKIACQLAALISVYDKTGVEQFVAGLLDLDYIVIASGGTFNTIFKYFKSKKHKKLSNIISVEDYTGSQEILGGRVKTLHPKIHGAILAQHNLSSDQRDIQNQHLLSIDVVAVTLYPFEKTVNTTNVKIENSIEHIDIGGVSLLRAASKNFARVLCISDPQDYKLGISLLQIAQRNKKSIPKKEKKLQQDLLKYRKHFASKAFSLTAHYETTIANYLKTESIGSLPNLSAYTSKDVENVVFKPSNYLSISYEQRESLRYGENPHQSASLYNLTFPTPQKSSLLSAKQLHGKQLSFNNIRDAESAILITKDFVRDSILPKQIAVGVKHGNPCGVALADDVYSAWNKCYRADPVSIFGGIVALSGVVNERTATALSKIFLEIIIAPKFSKAALNILTKKKNIRLLQLSFNSTKNQKIVFQAYSSIQGGLLVQDSDDLSISANNLTCVTKKKPSASQVDELLFAWKVCKYVKSNAIVVTKSKKTLGVGAGQMNRVSAAELALKQASSSKSSLKSAVLASDAFFPMSDTVSLAAQYGISSIIQPGGSIKDKDSIEVCNKYGISMVFTGIRHFLH